MKTTIAALALIAALAPPAYAVTEDEAFYAMSDTCNNIGNMAQMAYMLRSIGQAQEDVTAKVLDGVTNPFAIEMLEAAVANAFSIPETQDNLIAALQVQAGKHKIISACFDAATVTGDGA